MAKEVDAPFAASRWNRLREQAGKEYEHIKELCTEMLMVEGHPPFTQPRSESEEYHALVTASMTGNPLYTNDQSAKARLAELSLKYGPPPDIPIPIGQQMPNQPGAEASAFTGGGSPPMIP